MGEYLSHISWQNVGDVIASHQNFSHATWYCRNLQQGINCLGTEPKLKSNGKHNRKWTFETEISASKNYNASYYFKQTRVQKPPASYQNERKFSISPYYSERVYRSQAQRNSNLTRAYNFGICFLRNSN